MLWCAPWPAGGLVLVPVLVRLVLVLVRVRLVLVLVLVLVLAAACSRVRCACGLWRVAVGARGRHACNEYECRAEPRAESAVRTSKGKQEQRELLLTLEYLDAACRRRYSPAHRDVPPSLTGGSGLSPRVSRSRRGGSN
jgi:hypothetical protein